MDGGAGETQQRGGLVDWQSENDRPDDRLVWMLWRPYPWVEWAGIVLFLVAAVLTLWSMLQYLNAARGDLLDQ